MIVGFPFGIRRDNLETKVYEEGTIQAVMSELKLFFETEEGDVEHIPDYGVRKRDLLFNSDMDDAVLGVLLLRLQEKVNTWFKDLVVEDIYANEDAGRSKNLTLTIVVNYAGQEGQVEVDV